MAAPQLPSPLIANGILNAAATMRAGKVLKSRLIPQINNGTLVEMQNIKKCLVLNF